MVRGYEHLFFLPLFRERVSFEKERKRERYRQIKRKEKRKSGFIGREKNKVDFSSIQKLFTICMLNILSSHSFFLSLFFAEGVSH